MPTSARTSGPPASSGRVWAPAPTSKRRKIARRKRAPEVGAAFMAARGRGQAPPLWSILAGRYLPQQTSVGADAHVGPPLWATGQLRAGVGTRPYRLQVPQDSPPETEPRKGRAALVAAHSRGRGSAIQIEEAGGSVL